MTDLFDFNDNEEKAKPLAERMRASSFKDFLLVQRFCGAGKARCGRLAPPPRHLARPLGQLHLLGAARLRQDDARQRHRRAGGRGVRAPQRGDGRGRGRAPRRRGSTGRSAPSRPPHLSPFRRVPPLQQGAARFPAPFRRAGHPHLHRLDDGKPLRFHDARHRLPLPRVRI